MNLTTMAIATLALSGGNPITAPSLSGGPEKWVNSAPIDLNSRKGQVTLVEFWTFGCINCRHNLPVYARLDKRFRAKGLALIGVHTPETESERSGENVRNAVKKLGIRYPVLLDPDGVNWSRWQLHYWPTVFLVDKLGKIRGKWEGELNYGGADGEAEVARQIEILLEEKR